MNILKDNKNVVQNYFSQLIYASSDFAKILVDKYPVELYADIESMQKGATNCSCKTRVEEFCYNNREALLPVLEAFIKIKSPEFDDFVENINSMYNVTIYSGTIKEIHESEWSDMFTKMTEERAQFKAFSVIKNGDRLTVYFL